jgi:uncharacterized membrane protein YeiH
MQTQELIRYLNFNATFEVFDLVAVFIFAISGAQAAIKKRYDFIGILILAFFSGVGGGLIRDAIFIQAGPPVVVTDSKYLIVILCAFVLAMAFYKKISRMHKTMHLVDALGLGTYGVVGANLALQAGLVPLAAILVGVFNATGAGIIRDVLVREEPKIFKPGRFYAGAAIIGTVLYVSITVLTSVDDTLAAVLAISVSFILRILSVKFDWRTRPILKEEEESLS